MPTAKENQESEAAPSKTPDLEPSPSAKSGSDPDEGDDESKDDQQSDDTAPPEEEPEPEDPWDPETSLEQMRCSWQFASSVQFCRMFATTLKLKSFSVDILERALLIPDDFQLFLSELLYKLLRADASQPYQERDSENWEQLLKKKFSSRWFDHFDYNPVKTKSFFDLSPMRRVRIFSSSWSNHA